MTQKHTKPKPDPIVVQPEAEDVAQEGTQDVTEAPVAAPAVVGQAKTYTAVDGDSYAVLGAKFAPLGVSKHEHATYLFALNRGKAITSGTVIDL